MEDYNKLELKEVDGSSDNCLGIFMFCLFAAYIFINDMLEFNNGVVPKKIVLPIQFIGSLKKSQIKLNVKELFKQIFIQGIRNLFWIIIWRYLY